MNNNFEEIRLLYFSFLESYCNNYPLHFFDDINLSEKKLTFQQAYIYPNLVCNNTNYIANRRNIRQFEHLRKHLQNRNIKSVFPIKRYIVAGEKGCGKTSFLKRIVLESITESDDKYLLKKFGLNYKDWIPIYIKIEALPLNTDVNILCSSLLDIIMHLLNNTFNEELFKSLEFRKFIEFCLTKNNILLLVDIEDTERYRNQIYYKFLEHLCHEKLILISTVDSKVYDSIYSKPIPLVGAKVPYKWHSGLPYVWHCSLKMPQKSDESLWINHWYKLLFPKRDYKKMAQTTCEYISSTHYSYLLYKDNNDDSTFCIRDFFQMLNLVESDGRLPSNRYRIYDRWYNELIADLNTEGYSIYDINAVLSYIADYMAGINDTNIHILVKKKLIENACLHSGFDINFETFMIFEVLIRFGNLSVTNGSTFSFKYKWLRDYFAVMAIINGTGFFNNTSTEDLLNIYDDDIILTLLSEFYELIPETINLLIKQNNNVLLRKIIEAGIEIPENINLQ